MNPAAMTLPASKRPAKNGFPKATEILPAARPASRSAWASPVSAAAAKPQPAVREPEDCP